MTSSFSSLVVLTKGRWIPARRRHHLANPIAFGNGPYFFDILQGIAFKVLLGGIKDGAMGNGQFAIGRSTLVQFGILNGLLQEPLFGGRFRSHPCLVVQGRTTATTFAAAVAAATAGQYRRAHGVVVVVWNCKRQTRNNNNEQLLVLWLPLPTLM